MWCMTFSSWWMWGLPYSGRWQGLIEVSERFRVVPAGGTRRVVWWCANLFGNYHFYCNSVLQYVAIKNCLCKCVLNENKNFYEVFIKFNYNSTTFRVYYCFQYLVVRFRDVGTRGKEGWKLLCWRILLLLSTGWTMEEPGSSEMSAHFYRTECCHNVWFMVMFLFWLDRCWYRENRRSSTRLCWWGWCTPCWTTVTVAEIRILMEKKLREKD